MGNETPKTLRSVENKPVAESTSAMGFRFLKGFCLNLELVQIGQNLGLLIPYGPANLNVGDTFPQPTLITQRGY